MPIDLPEIGAREDLRTEFKRAEKLRSREGRRDIARAAVAMRNSQGGEIWIGLEERHERFVGLDPLEDADQSALAALRDQLLDSVEPLLVVGLDVKLEQVPVAGGWVVRVRVERRPQPPCCFVLGTKREFLQRVDRRNVSLSYASLFDTRDSAPLDLRVRECHAEWARKLEVPGLAFTALPEGSRSDNARDDVALPEAWRSAVESPPPRIARPMGWSWSAGRLGGMRARGAVLEAGGSRRDAPYRMLRLHADGRLHFFTALENLVWKETELAERVFPGAVAGQIYTYALVETLASLVRLVAHLYELHAPDAAGRVAFLVSLEGAEGWVVHRYGADSYAWLLDHEDRAAWVRFATASIQVGPLVRSTQDVVEEPDRLSHALLQRLFESDAELDSGEQERIPWFDDERTFAPPA